MNVEQAFDLARTAKRKLLKEASGVDPNLRQLLGHANLLDTLLVRIAVPIHKQATTSDGPVTKLAKTIEQKRLNMGWDVTVVEAIEDELDDDEPEVTDDDTDSGSDSDESVMSDEGDYDDLLSTLLHQNVFITHDPHGTPAKA
jgi:hypothetical protein